MIVITDNMRNGKMYDGNSAKFGISLSGVDYIIKMSKKGGLSVFTEYIASNFIYAVDIPCQIVQLGKYGNEFVDVIKDFTSGTEYTLHSFKETRQSSENTDISNKIYSYKDVEYLIEKHTKMSIDQIERSKRCFWDMFICDAILGNRDRHKGNWGYLSNGINYSFAPLYDNGGCLFPDVNKQINNFLVDKKSFLESRIFTFPASLFQLRRVIRNKESDYRTNYYEMFSDLRINKVFAERVRYFKSRYSYLDIFNIICSIVRPLGLSYEYTLFYIMITCLRYMCIVLRMDYNKAYNVVEGLINEISK